MLQDLSAAGTWTSPLVLTDSQKALGIKENTAYPVKYVYTVVEDVEGSTKPEGSTILIPVEAIVSDAQIEVEPGEEEVDGKEAVLTNIVADLEVVKEWNGGNTGHENDSATVQLYRLAVPEEGGGGHGGQQDDSKIEILIDTKWVYPDQTSAEESAIPTNGNISVTVTGDNDPSNTRTVNLEPSSWAIRVSDLDKTDSTGKNITYTVTYNQQYSQFYGKTVLVTTPANASVKGVNGKVTLTAQVEKPTQPEPVNTTMDVPFHVTWKTDKGVEKTPADNAVVIATVRNASGEVVKTVTLNKGNNWSSTETLPCIVNDETMNYTVTYTYSGTNVTNAGGTESFSGSGSQVEIVGVFREVSATRMAVQVVAEGLKGSNNGQSTWHVNMSDGAKGTRGNGNIYYYYIKEVSATTGADVEEIGAVYAYENLSETDDRLHKVTITNMTTIREIDVNIHKISSEDTDQDLPDAEFTLRKKAGPGSEGGEAPVYNGYEKVKTSSDGTITFSGLIPGDYLLIEENAPSGFNRLTKQIEFTVSTDGTITGFDKTAYDGLVDLSDTNGFVFIIKKEPGAELPYTGGPGTTFIYLLGILFLGFAGTGMMMRKLRRTV